MNTENTSMTVVIKDFNITAPNGNTYDLSDASTIKAIKKFCTRKEHFAELGNPRVDDIKSQDAKIDRLNTIPLDNVVAVISNPQFNAESKTITGEVRPFGSRFPDLLDKLRNNEVTFGMRAFVKHTDDSKHYQVYNIITFDVINAH